MANIANPFDVILDRMDRSDSLLEHLISIINQKLSTPVSNESSLLTTRQAAEFLGISPKTIYNNPGHYPHVKLKSGGLRFRKEDLEKLVAVSPRLA